MIEDMINKVFKIDGGLCIKRVQSCLNSFGVCFQGYYDWKLVVETK